MHTIPEDMLSDLDRVLTDIGFQTWNNPTDKGVVRAEYILRTKGCTIGYTVSIYNGEIRRVIYKIKNRTKRISNTRYITMDEFMERLPNNTARESVLYNLDLFIG